LKEDSQRVQVRNVVVVIGGDVIVKADQQDVKTNDELIRYIREKKPGDTIQLQILRKGKLENLKVTLGETKKEIVGTIVFL
jgi:S1-C subfamily serine protease